MRQYRLIGLACVSLIFNACSATSHEFGEGQVIAENTPAVESLAADSKSPMEQPDRRIQIKDTYESEIVGVLIDRLGVDQKQAWGGVGAVFALVQQRTDPEDFMQLSSSLPDMDRYLASVPSLTKSSFRFGMDRHETMESTDDNLLPLANSFRDLGMGTDLIARFVSIVLEYFQNRNELAAMNLLQNALY